MRRLAKKMIPRIIPRGIFRWSYIAPRLLILFVVMLVVHFTLDPLLRWGMIRAGESAVGAKVDLAAVRTSIWNGVMELEGLAITNPQSPMRNLVESGDSRFWLDTNALLHGRVVVTDGKIAGLQFDTNRETSGALEPADDAEDTGPSMFDPLADKAGEMGQEWFDQMGDRLDTDVVDQLQSPRLAKELKERWPAQYEQLQAQVKDIRERGKQLEKDVREVKANPLRGLERLGQLTRDVATLKQEVTSVQKQITNLPQQAAADRGAILAAREQDEALLRQKLQLGTLDGEGLTQTLLGQPVTDGLATSLEWVRWARDMMPAGEDAKKARGRGTTVLFTPPQPGYHIRQLQLEGLAQLNGEALPLIGTLTNASDAPRLLGEPTRLVLSGSEAFALDVEVVLDRRGEIAQDALHISCPQMAMAPRTLGNADKLAVEMGGGAANFQLDVTIVGEQLSGTILFGQQDLQLTPRLAKSPDPRLTGALNQALAGVNRLEANVALAGTLKKPKIKIQSDIGTQVAQGLNGAVQGLVKQQTDALLAKTRQEVDAQLSELTAMREEAQSKLMAQLGEGQELLGQLSALTGGGPGGLPAGIPQIGKSLRLGDILKK